MAMHDQENLSRRDLFRLSLSTAALLTLGGATLTLAGCGGGGGDDAETETRVVSGAVNRTELGAGELKIVSAQAEAPTVVASNGAFQIPASASNGQLLIATGADGKLRGYGLSLPGEPVDISATSTAAMMIMLSPGLASSNVDDARSALARIKAQPKFPALVTAVRTRMAAGTLASFASDTAIESLREEIVLGATSAAVNRGTGPVNSAINFSVAWGSSVAKNLQKLDMTHRGARFVRVDVQRQDAAGKPISTEVAKDVTGKELTAIPGGTFASVGSILTLTTVAPSTTMASLNLIEAKGMSHLKVYVSGMGIGPGSETPPRRLGAAEMGDAYGRTIVLIFLFPLVDLITGGLGALKSTAKLVEKAGAVWANVGSSLTLQSLHDSLESGDARGMVSAIIDATLALLGTGAALVGALAVARSPAAAVTAAIGLILAATLLPLTAANMAAATFYLKRTPRIQSVEIPVSASDVVVN